MGRAAYERIAHLDGEEPERLARLFWAVGVQTLERLSLDERHLSVTVVDSGRRAVKPDRRPELEAHSV